MNLLSMMNEIDESANQGGRIYRDVLRAINLQITINKQIKFKSSVFEF